MGLCSALVVRVSLWGQQLGPGPGEEGGAPRLGNEAEALCSVKVGPRLWERGASGRHCARRVSWLKDGKEESEIWAYWLVDDSNAKMGKFREQWARHGSRLFEETAARAGVHI